MIFSDRDCNYPQPAFGMWWLSQFRRWGMVKGAPDYRGVVKRVIRPDIYIDAMRDMGVVKKAADVQKITLFDGTFDASDPEKYAKSFPVNSLAS
jgi:nitrate/nitrite transport system substrate-binding protein